MLSCVDAGLPAARVLRVESIAHQPIGHRCVSDTARQASSRARITYAQGMITVTNVPSLSLSDFFGVCLIGT